MRWLLTWLMTINIVAVLDSFDLVTLPAIWYIVVVILVVVVSRFIVESAVNNLIKEIKGE